MALGAKKSGSDINVYTLLGDGEIEEGECWEAFMFANHYKLDNLCIMIDVNGLQIDGATRDVMNSEPLDRKMDAFGFNTIVCNGNSFAELEQAFKMFDLSHGSGKPTCFLLRTTKGLGVSYMQNAVDWRMDLVNCLIKSVVFAITVTWISLFNGYDAIPTSAGISRATTRTVVHSSLAVLGLDFVLTALMFGN